MPSVLFVCRANQFRSPIAAACLRKEIRRLNPEGNWIVDSAGTWAEPGLHIGKDILAITNRLGVSGLSRHITKRLNKELLSQFDLILAMESNQKEVLNFEFPEFQKYIYLVSEVVDCKQYDISDPTSPRVDADDIGKEICSLIRKGATKILELSLNLQEEKNSSGIS